MKPEVKKYLKEIGSKGGQSKSAAKLAAVRENGKLGGRPTKDKTTRKLKPKKTK
jgi:hypothetical protein